ncbi:hypothetical protein VKT23_014629 [Stygiomarasmius scandens]|uniref:Peptidase C1A papain C-terminal domain-containing protein n=1 Tax=Marasmiellus scandens TaxID=2682957 RepID=A0ABR1J2L4_9AGAR
MYQDDFDDDSRPYSQGNSDVAEDDINDGGDPSYSDSPGHGQRGSQSESDLNDVSDEPLAENQNYPDDSEESENGRSEIPADPMVEGSEDGFSSGLRENSQSEGNFDQFESDSGFPTEYTGPNSNIDDSDLMGYSRSEDASDESQTDFMNSESGGCCDCGSSKYGHIPCPPDSRDLHFEAVDIDTQNGVDLRYLCPPVYDQQAMLSCTAHAVAAAFAFEATRLELPDFSPSRLFIWYHARAKLGQDAIKKNCGTNIRDAIKSLDPKHAGYGVCSEDDWSYDPGSADKKTHLFHKEAKAAKKPPPAAYNHAIHHTAPKYFSFTRHNQELLHDLINCLDQGFPFVIGMKTFGLLKSEVLEMPKVKDTKGDEHRHTVLVVGYNPDNQLFIVRNSWGEGWGKDGGYFTMPFNYALKYCYDFWTIRLVKST